MTQEHQQDRLITLKELAALCGLSHRAVLQARTQGRFLLTVVRVSPRNLRVRLSDAQAVVRGERALMSGETFKPGKREKLHAQTKGGAK